MEKSSKPPKCRQKCKIPTDCHHENRTPHACHFGNCPACRQICQEKLSCGHICPQVSKVNFKLTWSEFINISFIL